MSIEIPGFIVEELRFLVRGGTAANLATVNEVPLVRELVVETDTLKLKLGDGVTHYVDLEYISTGGGSPVEFRVSGGYLQYSRDDGSTWVDLIAVQDLKGDKGDDGDSAYQVAVNNGFVGSQQDWLESIRGTPGQDSTVPGPKGEPGNDAVGAAVRGTVSFAGGVGTLPTGKVSLLIKIATDAPARIRLYSTASARANDAGRAANVAAPQGAGLLLEFISTAALLGAPLTPGVIAHNQDAVPTGVVYYNVQPAGASSNVELTYLKLEN